MRKILLVEPPYKNKYPPLGLMKISAYHKKLGDEVVFCKGKNKSFQEEKWDRIYIATLFTFYWNTTIETIKYYLKSVRNSEDVFIGGPMATIMADEIHCQKKLENITILKGLLDKPNLLDKTEYIVDDMIPDYSIIDISKNTNITYEYPVKDAYFVHTTRGCVRKCEFCAVPQIEPTFKSYVDIKPKIKSICERYGNRRDLMIMDNNILASPKFPQIIDDIVQCGFGIDNNDYKYKVNDKERVRKRFVDFNQGLDARLLYDKPEKMKLLARVAVKPLRIAFDHADDAFVATYTKCMWMAAENNIKDVSNYILFNFEDTPSDLYKRLEVNVWLNKEFEEKNLKTRIWSFPMRFSPIFDEKAKGRKYLGTHWARKQLRGVQCVLNATHGVVGPKLTFFKKAFGENIGDFNKLLWMPENYILYRNKHIENGKALKWNRLYSKLDEKTLQEFHTLIGDNIFVGKKSHNKIILKLLKLYQS